MERQSRWIRVGCLTVVWILAFRVSSAQLTAPTPVPISPAGEICHDFPDVAVTSPGAAAIAAWTGYNFTADQDEIYTAALLGSSWQAAAPTGITGDLFSPRLGNAGGGDVQIVWAQQVSGNWDLYARPMDGGTIAQLTADAGSDINAATASDPSRERFFVVWQGFRSGRSAIFLLPYADGSWGSAKVVSQPAANEWFPKAAVDSTGRVWIAWDSYRNGNHDVFLRSYWPDGDSFSPEVQVTANLKFEGNVSIACDSDNRVWMTWEIGRENWGKDQGRLTSEARLNMPVGRTFMNNRRVAVGVYDGGAVKTTAVAVNTLIPLNTFDPIMAVDAHDRAWVFYAQRVQYGTGAQSGWAGWQYVMTRYDDKVTTWSWDTAVDVPTSLARVERKMAAARYDDSRLVAVWHVDGRWKGTGSTSADLRHGPPDGNRIYAALVDVPSVTDQDPPLTAPAQDAPVDLTHPNEPADVAAMRAYTPTFDGRTHQLLRGDFHRHNDISWDGNGDGSLEDLFRYAYDVATLDFVMPSDHHTQLEGNNKYPNWNFYPWRRTQKYDDLYYSAGVLAPFFGYERSRSYPNGHRNVAYPTRGPRGDWIVHNQSATPLGYDENYLWDLVRGRGGITISHTSGNGMGTSWDYDVNTNVETVMEIYQGCRYSYENYVDDRMWPNMERRPDPTGNEVIHSDGYYFSMLSQRLPSGDFRNKLGIVSSSDHGATHLSYACVYAEENTREGILAAIKARHTYGAMDNIILDVRCGTAIMGDEIALPESPRIDIFVDSPKPLNQVALIRDNAVLYTWNPGGDPDPTRFSGSYTDAAFTPGYHYYYVRARQNDGSDAYGLDGTMAWSSPIWIRNTVTRVKDWQRF